VQVKAGPQQKSPPEFSIPPQPRREHVWAARRMVGWSVFAAFDVAFLAYLVTLSAWWFLLPVVTFVFAQLFVGRRSKM
jgi:hypothetical protein